MFRVDGNKDLFDLVIIGAGPAGITAAIYAARANIKCCLVEGNAPGGKMLKTGFVENYPGVKKTTGPDLGIAMFNQINELNVPIYYSAVTNCEKVNDYFITYLNNGESLISKTVIVATGTKERPLGLVNEEKFLNKGISYCAICDGSLFKGKDVAVVGGGNGAVEESMYLAGVVNKVYLVHRRDEFRADSFAVDNLKKFKNVEFCLSYIPFELKGDATLQQFVITSVKNNEKRTLEVACVFPYIGSNPVTSFLSKFNILNEGKYVIVDEKMETSIPGLFAAGDCIIKKYRQISTAINDGTIAALSAKEFLNKIKK